MTAKSALSEDGEIEWLTWPKPNDVRRVISKTVAGFSVGEDGKPEAIEYSPSGKISKSLRGDGKLKAPTWVRSNRALVEMSD